MKHCPVLLAAVCLMCLPRGGFAQDASHWGIVGSVTPQWKVPSQLEKLFDGTVDLQGTDLTIGIARGRSRSGDWGASFIHKKFKDGSRVDSVKQDCQALNGCFKKGEVYTTRGVAINGLEVHKFIPFVRVHDRVQIGMNLAGGVGKFTGTLDDHEFTEEFISFDQASNRPIVRQGETMTTKSAKELTKISVFPIFKLQASVAVIASPAFKLRFQGGIDLPGYEVISIAGVFFFGAR
jgi:hypothetical protein